MPDEEHEHMLLIPIVIEAKPNVLHYSTYSQSQASPTSFSPDIKMRADDSKVCVSRCPFCRYHNTPYDRASLALLGSSALSLVPPRRASRTSLFLLSPPKSSPPHRATETGPQTHSTSSPLHHLLIPSPLAQCAQA